MIKCVDIHDTDTKAVDSLIRTILVWLLVRPILVSIVTDDTGNCSSCSVKCPVSQMSMSTSLNREFTTS